MLYYTLKNNFSVLPLDYVIKIFAMCFIFMDGIELKSKAAGKSLSA